MMEGWGGLGQQEELLAPASGSKGRWRRGWPQHADARHTLASIFGCVCGASTMVAQPSTGVAALVRNLAEEGGTQSGFFGQKAERYKRTKRGSHNHKVKR